MRPDCYMPIYIDLPHVNDPAYAGIAWSVQMDDFRFKTSNTISVKAATKAELLALLNKWNAAANGRAVYFYAN